MSFSSDSRTEKARPAEFSGWYALIIIAILLLPSGVLSEQSEPSNGYTFSVVPQQASSRLARLWVPLLRAVSEQSGVKLRFKTAPDIPTFEERLGKKKYDFSYMNPYHYVVFHKYSGYEAFLRRQNKPITGILVVRKDSGINDIQDLSGKMLAFPSPAAFAASILTRKMLEHSGVHFTPKYVGSHDSVYRAVSSGIHVAGGGVKRTFNSIPESIRDNLRILITTDRHSPHAFAALESVPEEVVMKVQKGFLKVALESPELLSVLSIPALEKASDHHWNDIRELQITQEESELKLPGGAQ
jgi:phosphonate transport system substrate-binding protein